MKKRYVLKRKSRFFGITAAILLLLLICTYVSSVHANEDKSYKIIRVEKGDTLWDIAVRYKKQGDIRKYIHKLMEINNLKDGKIYAGDQLLIPQ
ncbi:MAG TPA: LysM peptidoglycan-binding domain-containing protein [Clostridiaceae bacterium]|nr:LysM peptidoglycan-binding domain-containing protein [Clostridiaceae bacterium]